MLIHQTNVMFQAGNAAIDVWVLNLTALGEPIRKTEWKAVYEDSLGLKTAN